MAYSEFLNGEVILMANTRPLTHFLFCDGSSQSRSQFPDLFDIIKYTYGGSGDEFRLPNLTPPLADMAYHIRTGAGLFGPVGSFSEASGVLGDIRYLAGPVRTYPTCPLANGSLLPVATNPGSFSVLGYRFGGSGSNFQLPTVPDLGPTPGVTAYFLNAGVYPLQSAGYAESLMSQIRLATPTYVEAGFLPCDGATYYKELNTLLSYLLGNNFGGDQNTYAVPTLPQIAGIDQRICAEGYFPDFA